MTNQDTVLLNAVSEIDPQVIDTVSRERYRRLQNGGSDKRPGGSPFKWVAIAACLCLLLPLGISLFLGKEQKQIPVYQGMTISSAPLSDANAAFDDTPRPLALGLWDTTPSVSALEHHDNWYGTPPPTDNRDFEDRHPQETRPLKDILSEQTPETDAEGSTDTDRVPTADAAHALFYAKRQEDVYITVHVSNPDNYEILSFTLNGKTYASYMFESGSDMENLILKYNVGDAQGIVDYTIDGIKYVDGTEIKDVLMEGDKTVCVGVYTENQPHAEIKALVVGINSLSFTVQSADPLDLIAQSGGTLYAVVTDGSSLLWRQALTVGESTAVKVNSLATGSYYTCAVVAEYDALDGVGMDSHILAEVSGYTQTVVGFDNVTVTQDTLRFETVWNDAVGDKTPTSVVLYLGDERVQTLSPTATAATGLLSGQTYRLVLTYQNGENTESAEITFTTKERTAPTLGVTVNSATADSLSFAVTLGDPDGIGKITEIALLHGTDAPILASGTDARTFEGLLSNADYTLRVTCTYDLGDGAGAKTLTKTAAATTKAKTAPTLSFPQDFESTLTAVSGSLRAVDPDRVLLRKTVSLYRQNALVATLVATTEPSADGRFAFDGLQYGTAYTVQVTYTYDLGDGKGTKTQTVSKEALTTPYFDLTSCAVRNTSAVSDGDTVFLQMELDNPLGAKVTEVCINGSYYAVTNTVTSNRITLEIVNNGQFTGGNTTLTVEKCRILQNGKAWEITPSASHSATVFINAKVKILSCYMADENYQMTHALVVGRPFYLMLELDNPADYPIVSIDAADASMHGGEKYDLSEIVKIKNGLYACRILNNFPFDSSLGYDTEMYSVSITAVRYRITDLSVVTAYPDKQSEYYSYFRIFQNEVRTVSTPEDLKNMAEGICYELINDIDLAGIEWTAVPFCGILNGNGYAIRNMSLVRNITNGDDGTGNAHIGLFSGASGLIRDLHIENCSFIVSSDTVSLMYGAIAASADYDTLDIINCSVDADSYAILSAPCVFAGGIAGVANYLYGCYNYSSLSVTNTEASRAGGIASVVTGMAKQCVNYGNISVHSSALYVDGGACCGGISGYGGKIVNCINHGNIEHEETNPNGSHRIGGIMVGEVGGGIIINCLNTGKISSNDTVAGICDATEYTHHQFIPPTVRSCLNVGTLIAPTTYGIACKQGCTATDSYAFSLKNNSTGNTVTLAELATPDFYINVLGWDPTIWNFENLDPQNGRFPTLR